MDNIIKTNQQIKQFNFSNIDFNKNKKLIKLSNDAYMIKIYNKDNKHLFIQTPLSSFDYSLLLKNIKSNIKINNLYKTTLTVHTNHNDDYYSNFYSFMQNLEIQTKELINENAKYWFNNFNEDDIDFFYKEILEYSNNDENHYYVFFDLDNILDKPDIKCFNHELTSFKMNKQEYENIKNSNVYCFLECRGIIFTSNNFFLCLVVKQILLPQKHKNNDINTCLFEKLELKKNNCDETNEYDKLNNLENNFTNHYLNDSSNNNINYLEENYIKNNKDLSNNNLERTKSIRNDTNNYVNNNDNNDNDNDNNSDNDTDNDNDVYLDIAYINNKKNNDYLEEIKLDIEKINENDEIKLKEPNVFYKEIYREIKKRAKEYRKKAIQSYLEAKHIKNTFLLNEINISDNEESNNDTSDNDSIYSNFDNDDNSTISSNLTN